MSSKSKKKKVVQLTSKITYLIFFVLSVIFLFLLKSIIPNKFFTVLLVINIITWLILGVFAVVKKIKRKVKVTQIVICLLLSVLLVFLDVMIPVYSGKISRLFTKIPENGEMNISVYTLASSSYDNIEQLANQRVGIQNKVDVDYQAYAIKVIDKEIKGADVQVVQSEDIYSLVEMLYSGEVEAILLNEDYVGIISDNNDFKDFKDKTKSVYTCSQKVTLVSSTSSVSNIVKQPFTIAVSGNDQWDYQSINPTSNSRTDVNILVTVNPTTKQVLIVTIPRDSYVYLEGKDYDKLTHASVYGMQCWVNAIKRILSLDEINYYFRVNFQSVSDIVDALGGVVVDNPYYFESSYCLRWDENLNKAVTVTESFEEGLITLDGCRALGYVRERYSLPEGDLSRNQHQAIFLKACIDKVCSVSTITNISKILDALEGTFITDISFNDILALAQMQLDDMADWNIVTYSLIGYGDYRQCYSMDDDYYSVEILYEDSVNKAQQLINDVLSGQIISQE